MIKYFELRDAATFIPLAAWRPYPSYGALADLKADAYLIARAGFGSPLSRYLIVTMLTTLETQYNPAKWNCKRTMMPVHEYLKVHFDTLVSGSVVDPRVIRGDRENNPTPERLWKPGMSCDD